MINLRIGDQVCPYFRAPATGWKWVRTGPYRITGITRGCTCPTLIDIIDRDEDTRVTPRHVHLECVSWEYPHFGKILGTHFYLSHIDERHLDHVYWGFNSFIVIGERGPEPQMELFDAD